MTDENRKGVTTNLRDLAWRAFVAGINVTDEGYNGVNMQMGGENVEPSENPSIRAKFDEWYKSQRG